MALWLAHPRLENANKDRQRRKGGFTTQYQLNKTDPRRQTLQT